MNLIDRFMAGLEFREPSRNVPRPLDFAVSNETGSLLMLADWWTAGWGMGTGLIYVPSTINPRTLAFEGMADQGISIATATDGFFADQLRNARARTDLDRGRYYIELKKLVEFEPNFDFMPWIEAVMQRPTIDAVEVQRVKRTGMRSIGRLAMRDDDGDLVDLLVIDDQGQVSTYQDDGWLALFAAQWAGYAEDSRPDIASFLGWLAQQRPYGPFTLDEPQVTSSEGELDAIVVSTITSKKN